MKKHKFRKFKLIFHNLLKINTKFDNQLWCLKYLSSSFDWNTFWKCLKFVEQNLNIDADAIFEPAFF